MKKIKYGKNFVESKETEIRQIIGELILKEKYKYADKNLIAEVVWDTVQLKRK